jgi:acyl-coenzyme A synthetase/AMP-(fatty) acid ligase
VKVGFRRSLTDPRGIGVVIRSPHPDVTIGDAALTQVVLERAEERGEKAALVDGSSGRTISYGQLAGSVARVGAGLAARGFKKGDVFAIFCPNMPEFVVAFHAVASIGGINTTVNSLYTGDEVAFQLKDSGARFLLTVPAFMDRAADASGRAGIEEIFVLGRAEGATPFADLAQGEGGVPEVDIDPAEDLVCLPYSSGTTGFPKGVMLTHRNLVANICQFEYLHHLTEQDRVVPPAELEGFWWGIRPSPTQPSSPARTRRPVRSPRRSSSSKRASRRKRSWPTWASGWRPTRRSGPSRWSR